MRMRLWPASSAPVCDVVSGLPWWVRSLLWGGYVLGAGIAAVGAGAVAAAAVRGGAGAVPLTVHALISAVLAAGAGWVGPSVLIRTYRLLRFALPPREGPPR